MKFLSHILPILGIGAIILSCNSQRYAAGEVDDIYYSAKDRQAQYNNDYGKVREVKGEDFKSDEANGTDTPEYFSVGNSNNSDANPNAENAYYNQQQSKDEYPETGSGTTINNFYGNTSYYDNGFGSTSCGLCPSRYSVGFGVGLYDPFFYDPFWSYRYGWWNPYPWGWSVGYSSWGGWYVGYNWGWPAYRYRYGWYGPVWPYYDPWAYWGPYWGPGNYWAGYNHGYVNGFHDGLYTGTSGGIVTRSRLYQKRQMINDRGFGSGSNRTAVVQNGANKEGKFSQSDAALVDRNSPYLASNASKALSSADKVNMRNDVIQVNKHSSAELVKRQNTQRVGATEVSTTARSNMKSGQTTGQSVSVNKYEAGNLVRAERGNTQVVSTTRVVNPSRAQSASSAQAEKSVTQAGSQTSRYAGNTRLVSPSRADVANPTTNRQYTPGTNRQVTNRNVIETERYRYVPERQTNYYRQQEIEPSRQVPSRSAVEQPASGTKSRRWNSGSTNSAPSVNTRSSKMDRMNSNYSPQRTMEAPSSPAPSRTRTAPAPSGRSSMGGSTPSPAPSHSGKRR